MVFNFKGDLKMEDFVKVVVSLNVIFVGVCLTILLNPLVWIAGILFYAFVLR